MRPTVLAVLLVGSLAAAGCTGTTDDGSLVDVSYDSGNVVVVDGEDGTTLDVPVTNDTGTVVGRVLSDAGFALPAARVTVAGADSGNVTDTKGWFQVTNVKPGLRGVHVEREYYRAADSEVQVEAGKVTRLTITMIPLTSNEGFNVHPHDYWDGKDTYTVASEVIKFENPLVCVLYVTDCDHSYDIVPAVGRIVPPGTSNVTIDVSLTPGELFEYEVYELVLYTPPVESKEAPGKFESITKTYKLTEGTERFEFALDRSDLTDHGHAQFTAWQFRLWERVLVLPYTSGHVGGGAVYDSIFRSDLSVTVTAHKGDLVADPPHPRYWKDSDRVKMPPSSPTYVRCAATSLDGACARTPNSMPSSEYNGNRSCGNFGCLTLNPGGVVPPGTTRIEFDLEQWWDDLRNRPELEPARGLVPPDDFVLGYKGANVRPSDAKWEDYKWIEPVGTYVPEAMDGHHWATGRRYVITSVPANSTDPFYSRLSDWTFMLGVRGHETADSWADMKCSNETCGDAIFELKNFIVINENREEMLLGGAA